MIAVDTSALARIFLRESGYARYQEAIFRSALAQIPISAVVEFASIRRFGEMRIGWLRTILDRENVSVIAVEPAHQEVAIDAVLRYGRGSGHAAQLNFGDCLVYAVARYRDLPLLFAGTDFTHTDVIPALPPET